MIPRATYRLQLNGEFGFAQAAQVVPYLQNLGVSHAYLSPYLKARPGSPHGYDIVDHHALNPELGDEAAFRHLCDTLKAHSLGHLLDFVPNHMGVGGADNPLWLEVLEWGADAPHAGWFDIDWDPERRYLHGKLLAPLLGDQYGVELDRGMLRLKFDPQEGSFAVWAYDTHKLPICPTDYGRILTDGDLGLEELADAFAWLPNWRGQMPRRAAELKARLAQAARVYPGAKEALRAAVARFDGEPGHPDSWRMLHELIQTQHWRVAYFRVAADDINYRRFFNINDLAGLRMELPEVFDHAHQRILTLIKEGVLDGLRIDHIDGLYDPRAYLRHLHRRVSQRRTDPNFYLVVEKILSAHESLREDWPIHGTTGYDFLNQSLGLLIDASAERAFTATYQEFAGEPRSFADMVRLSKLHIMENEMSGELNTLARDMARLARQNPRSADFTQNLLRRAIKEVIACFPVYRTYLDPSGVLDSADQRDLSWALSRARRNETEIDPSVFGFLEQVLMGSLLQTPRSGYSRQSLLRCAMRLQQYSGPVDAKGLEDTAFYRYNRFIALNEVGGDPDRFGTTLAAFHRANALRAQHWPHAMLTLATHDTKRGADGRARLAALSELSGEWRSQLPAWSRILRGSTAQGEAASRPDRNDEYLLYQLLLGSWPCELLDPQAIDADTMRAYAQRVARAMIKSLREARVHTNWAFPNAEYEESVTTLIDTILTGARAAPFLAAFVPFARQLAALGARNSLLQTVAELTAPGVPDLYNGTELWQLDLVDPDNRRPVDYALRTRLLAALQPELQRDRCGCMSELLHNWSDGRIKLATVMTLLQHRRECGELYAAGDYQPLSTSSPDEELICAYARTWQDRILIVVLGRLPQRREARGLDATAAVLLPAPLQRPRWRELLTGRSLTPETRSDLHGLRVAQLLETLPVAVLEPQPPTSSSEGDSGPP